jgi:RHH-type transcriptional regulator, rel operon repressor / antitoxin RelB
MLVIRLPENIEARLDRLAKRTGRTKTYYAREAILQYLDDMEDIYLAEKELQGSTLGAQPDGSTQESNAQLRHEGVILPRPSGAKARLFIGLRRHG